MALSQNIIIFWNGTDADIPLGWSRKVELDGLFLKGIATNTTEPGTTGGGVHTHTSGTHTHTQEAHNHNVSFGSVTGGNEQSTAGNGVCGNHSHSWSIGDATVTNTTDSGLIIAGASANPPYVELISIISGAGEDGIPVSGIVYYASNTPWPENFVICDGNNGTPDLVDKFIKVPAAGLGAGGTGGGAHTHTVSPHNHTQSSHRHGISSGGGGTNIVGTSSTNPTYGANTGHSHSGVSDYTTAVNSATVVTLQDATIEPPYIYLYPIQNIGSGALLPEGIICIWTGLLADIPAGWYLCDGENGTPDLTNKFIKATNSVSLLKITGGSENAHSHTANSHTHSVTAHKHSGTAGGPAKSRIAAWDGGLTYQVAGSTHTHGSTWSNSSPANSSTVVAINDSTEDTRPPYYEVAYIQYGGGAGGRQSQIVIIV